MSLDVRLFGPYRLDELLGRGGMGEVYRAYDTEHRRNVAIKLLAPHLADDEEFQARFRREAFSAARLSNPHIVPIHRYGVIDDRLYIDMRLVEGGDLDQLVSANGPLELDRTVRMIEQVASALEDAHRNGLVHRDVKPSNILLDGQVADFCYLADFGVTRLATTLRSNSLTRTGGSKAPSPATRSRCTAATQGRPSPPRSTSARLSAPSRWRALPDPSPRRSPPGRRASTRAREPSRASPRASAGSCCRTGPRSVSATRATSSAPRLRWTPPPAMPWTTASASTPTGCRERRSSSASDHVQRS